MANDLGEFTILEGKYPLKDQHGKATPPELFLELFRNRPFYEDTKRFVRHVDNDTGIPFLTKQEYENAKQVLPKNILQIYENEGFITQNLGKVFLRGKRYYLNYADLNEPNKTRAENALDLLVNNMNLNLELYRVAESCASQTQNLEQRMIVGSLLDLYKNHLLVVFTGLFESMKENESISIGKYNLLRKNVERVIDDYYKFIIIGQQPNSPIKKEALDLTLEEIRQVIKKTCCVA